MKRRVRINFWNVLARFTYISALILMVVIGWWSFYPYNVIEIESPLPTSSQVINREQVLTSKVAYTKHNDLRPSNVSKAIICEDGNLVTLVGANGQGLPRGSQTLEIETIIPAKTSKSICKVTWRAEFKPNPIRTVVVNFETEPFQVI